MAVWWKPLLLLPLLFASAFAWASPGRHPRAGAGARARAGAARPISARHPGAGIIFDASPKPTETPRHPGAGIIFDASPKPTETPTIKVPLLNNADKKPNLETNFTGAWKVDNPNAGVAAMQLQLMPTGRVVWFDATSLGPSGVVNNPRFCRKLPNNGEDCHAHAIEYDPWTSSYRTMKFLSDPWCSCGGLAPNGDLVSIGGAKFGNDYDAEKAIRILSPDVNSEFRENLGALADRRWYSSQVTLEDGSFMVVGGRGSFSYELVPPSQLSFPHKLFYLPFLKETNTPGAPNTPDVENNLYPFLHLLPDGNVFLFANSKSIILEPRTGKVVRNLPELPGGSRNYPSSGMSALLPLDLTANDIKAEVIVCGGNSPDAHVHADRLTPRVFLPALNDCNRLVVTQPNAQWDEEVMPSPRVMGDMLLLPTGDILMINGAKKGCSSWESADEPNFTPVLYSPNKPKGQRMKELAPTTIARMYHSSSSLLQDGNILVAGSNPHQYYNFTAMYPSELRVEKFSPPYLAPEFMKVRPVIAKASRSLDLEYGKPFEVHTRLKVRTLEASEIQMTMYAPPFTTHGFSQNQRLLVLGLTSVSQDNMKAVAPPSPKVAPPGYYLLFIIYRGVPSVGRWVRLLP